MSAANDCPRPNFVALILAAGGSRRFGQSKQLFEWQGETLLGRSVRLARASGAAEIWVTLGADLIRHKAHLRTLAERSSPPIRMLPVWKWRSGMSAGLRSAASTWQRLSNGKIAGLLLLNVDFIDLEAESLLALVAHWQKAPEHACASRYLSEGEKVVGAPAMLPRSWIENLRELRGDQGARGLLRKKKGVRVIETAHPGDLDQAFNKAEARQLASGCEVKRT